MIQTTKKSLEIGFGIVGLVVFIGLATGFFLIGLGRLAAETIQSYVKLITFS